MCRILLLWQFNCATRVTEEIGIKDIRAAKLQHSQTQTDRDLHI